MHFAGTLVFDVFSTEKSFDVLTIVTPAADAEGEQTVDKYSGELLDRLHAQYHNVSNDHGMEAVRVEPGTELRCRADDGPSTAQLHTQYTNCRGAPS